MVSIIIIFDRWHTSNYHTAALPCMLGLPVLDYQLFALLGDLQALAALPS